MSPQGAEYGLLTSEMHNSWEFRAMSTEIGHVGDLLWLRYCSSIYHALRLLSSLPVILWEMRDEVGGHETSFFVLSTLLATEMQGTVYVTVPLNERV